MKARVLGPPGAAQTSAVGLALGLMGFFLAGLTSAEEPRVVEPTSARDAAVFALPEVTDPLLEPVPRPRREVTSFREARELLERRSPDLALARADVERARGILRQSLAGALPSITSTASLAGRPLQPTLIPTLTPPSYTYLAQIVASERIVAPATWKLIGASERDVERAQLSAEDMRRRVYGGLAEALLGVVVTERAAELARDGLRSSLQTLTLWTRRHDVGVGTELDLARLSQDVASARLALIERTEAVRRAHEALGMALGTVEPWGLSAVVDAAAVESSVRASCAPQAGPNARPDVAAALVSVDVAERMVKKTQAEFAPTVDLVTTIGMQPASFASTEPAANVQIAGVVTFSIWDGGARYGSLRIARANVDAAHARHDRVRREAELQASQATRAIGVAEAALSAARDSRDRARDADRLVRAALRVGVGSTLDLVQAQALLRRTDTEVALREYEVVRAKVEQFLLTSRCSP
ncbi:MAG: TolC family protein [Deltaproteobacteria bacterium]|nr:TolC family protein [Deltaproteobacteria bacterium]